MEAIVRKMQWLVTVTLFVGVAACSDNAALVNTPTSKNPSVEKISLDVYKSQTCGCCEKWVTYVEAFGFETAVHHPANLNQVKFAGGSPRVISLVIQRCRKMAMYSKAIFPQASCNGSLLILLPMLLVWLFPACQWVALAWRWVIDTMHTMCFYSINTVMT